MGCLTRQEPDQSLGLRSSSVAQTAMQNDEGRIVDLYLPRKCSATNRLIAAKEHGSVQLNFAQVDEQGIYNGEFYTFAIAGFIRNRGESDACLNRLLYEK